MVTQSHAVGSEIKNMFFLAATDVEKCLMIIISEMRIIFSAWNIVGLQNVTRNCAKSAIIIKNTFIHATNFFCTFGTIACPGSPLID